MSPNAENIRFAADLLRELARNPVPNVLILRDIAVKLDWVALSVEQLENKRTKLKMDDE